MALNSKDAFDMQIKLLMIGDSGVGKTCLLLRYANDSFSPTFITTIGIDFKIKNIHLDGKRIKLQIWDTAGQERFRTITTSYFRGAQGILLVYDVTDRNSFISIRNWVAQIQMHADVNVNKILIGNKCDCQDRAISYEEGESLAREYKIHFYETSAKMDLNVEKSFVTIATDVKNRLIADGGTGGSASAGQRLANPNQAQPRTRCC
jgi:Ras-related protein Rab-8A